MMMMMMMMMRTVGMVGMRTIMMMRTINSRAREMKKMGMMMIIYY